MVVKNIARECYDHMPHVASAEGDELYCPASTTHGEDLEIESGLAMKLCIQMGANEIEANIYTYT